MQGEVAPTIGIKALSIQGSGGGAEDSMEVKVGGARWTPLAARCYLRPVHVFIIAELRHERWRKVCCSVSCATGGKEVMAMEWRPLP